MRYKTLPDIATADVAFEVRGQNLKELFENAAFATSDIMVDVRTIKQKIKKTIKLKNKELDFLLYDLLAEVVYLKDAESLLFSKFNIEVTKNKSYGLKAVFLGDKINENQKLRNDVKAVTMHLFKIEKQQKGYKATIVLDL